MQDSPQLMTEVRDSLGARSAVRARAADNAKFQAALSEEIERLKQAELLLVKRSRELKDAERQADDIRIAEMRADDRVKAAYRAAESCHFGTDLDRIARSFA